MKQTKVDSLAALARALGFNYQRVLRASSKGVLQRQRGRYDIEHCRSAIETLAAQRQAGNAPDPIMLKWARRKKRAEALRLEKELKVDEPRTITIARAAEIIRQNEIEWVGQTRTIDRQLGGQFGGALGRKIEAASRALHLEMFTKISADPRRGPVSESAAAGGRL
jgi:hypothetical protein